MAGGNSDSCRARIVAAGGSISWRAFSLMRLAPGLERLKYGLRYDYLLDISTWPLQCGRETAGLLRMVGLLTWWLRALGP